jgi:Fe-S cluster assembly protein SufD
MSEALDYYLNETTSSVANIRSTTPWVAALQQAGVDDLTRHGLPTTHIEDWKYTRLDSFVKHAFVTSPKSSVEVLPLTQALSAGSQKAVGGDFLPLPEGVLIKPLAQMIVEHPELVKPYLGQLLVHEHGVHALNTAMLRDGIVIYLPREAKLAEPIVLRHKQATTNQAVYLRHLVIAAEGSKATIIEEYTGEDSCTYFTSTVTEIALAARADITHYKIQCEGKLAYHLGHVIVRQGESSTFSSHSLSLGGQLVRSDLTISLDEPKARCLLNGIYLPGDKQHVDHHTRVNHRACDCESEQDYKGIMIEKSRAVFNGQVIVARGAQKTRANQQNRNLLLSADAEIDTKPQLEIDADDVVCSHGATVGQLDTEAVFYLSSRGLSKKQVERILLHAFVAKNLQWVNNAALHAWMVGRINQKLGMNDND